MCFSRAKCFAVLTAALLGGLSPEMAGADTIGPVTISEVGVQGGQIYIHSPDIPAVCGAYAYLRLNSSVGDPPYVMSLLLSAKLSGTRLSRIDFHQGDPCIIDLVQM